MSSTQVAVIVVVVLVVAVLAVAAWYLGRRRALRQRFGPEYDRAVEEQPSRQAAERELRERERRHAELTLHELDPAARDRYAAEWREIQSRFLDDPTSAVRDADVLVTQLVAERGYPTGDYDEQVTHLSVEHARTLGHYRDAHDISLVSERGEATTEQLRQGLVHYRVLFADLLGESVTPDTPQTAPAAREEVQNARPE